MAEQDRYNSHLGANPTQKEAHLPKAPQGSGAEQDRYGGWFGGGKGPAAAKEVSDRLPQTSGAEQDRYGRWFGGDKGSAIAHDISGRLPKVSGAEQDRYEGHFGGDKGSAIAHDISGRLPKVSGAEQDRYEGHFGGDRGSAAARSISERLPQTSGAEQDRYARWWGEGRSSAAASEVSAKLPQASGAEQDRFGSHFSTPRPGPGPGNPIPLSSATAVGLLQTAVLPSFGFHVGLSAVAYGVSRYADRVEGKDWLWPSAQVASAWWSAVGLRVVGDGLSPAQAWSTLTYPQKTLLTGVSAWGLRLFYRVVTRSVRRGADDPRYVEAKKKSAGDKKKFWNRAFVSAFLPEAAVQTLVTLPFTLPFRAAPESAYASPALSADVASLAYGIAVFLFGAGFALEALADAQLEAHGRKATAGSELNREGVWSIVRHPNYLGDALVHLSFPVLLLGAGLLHPLALIGPVANYVFLRLVGGDREAEASQERRYAAENPAKLAQLREYRSQKNSFWPAPQEVANRWTWIVVAAGAGGVLLERGVRAVLLRG